MKFQSLPFYFRQASHLARAGLFTALVSCPCLVPALAGAEELSLRERISFNKDWLFSKGEAADLPKDRVDAWLQPMRAPFKKTAEKESRLEGDLGAALEYVQPGFNDSGWRKLNLPHDWGIEGPFDQNLAGETGKLPWSGIGWYRKHFAITEADQGRNLYLDLDGAMSNSLIWLNGKLVGGWRYGYSSFRVDLTPYVNFSGENVLAIRLDNPPDSSRWYPGGGIYRNVWMVKTSPVHVAQWGTQLATLTVSPDSADIDLNVAVDNRLTGETTATVKTEIYALNAQGLKEDETLASISSPALAIAGHGSETANLKLKLKQPRLWSLETPYLYLARTTVWQEGKAVDSYDTTFGIRDLKFTVKEGFSLNGKVIPIRGVCNHHDLGALGTAINIRALERQIELLKEMGCNAIRTSHNPPAPELLELCDRIGMLVMVETFDCWAQGKKGYDYGQNWALWHEADLRAVIRRDRNHPSVILWSTGNEVAEQWADGISKELTQIIHEEDSSRFVTTGASSPESGFNGFQKTVDVFGLNYNTGRYGKFREVNPDIPFYGSETASTVSSRGEYFFPLNWDGKSGDGKSDFQVSSYDLYFPGWANTPDAGFAAMDKYSLAGEFVWTGFDYLGEPTPYNSDATNLLNMADPKEKERLKAELEKLGKIQVPSRSSYFGIFDLAGFKKDRFYLYQARWRPDFPMAHILPHWNWPERVGEVTPVHVYTSGDEAELFLNGKSLGRKKKEAGQYRLRWDEVKYEPGELKVTAYKDGKVWAEDTVKTTGAAEHLNLTPDRKTIKADGKDLSFVTVAINDAAGLVAPRSKNLVKFEISGPGEIIAVDNGDATSHESFQAKEQKAFNGLALVIVRSKEGESGEIVLKARSEGLQGADTTLIAR